MRTAAASSKGDTVQFTIKVKNIGDGIARAVDARRRPAERRRLGDHEHRLRDHAGRGTTGQVLACDFGDMASGEEIEIVLTGDTDVAACGTLDNTASATATNEGSRRPGQQQRRRGAIDVKCAGIDIEKDADPDGPVSAGDEIGFNVTVTNTGAGTAYNVHAD